ncbi:hypothetical protein KKF32_04005 [Patescibacteria group bacterium]|nr:hypothetical protein [Patescibacteria group bacterium]
MNKTTKLIYYVYNFSIGLLLLAIVSGTIFWLIMSKKAEKEQQQIQQAINLVKNKIDFEEVDYFGGCLHPDNGVTIVSVNHEEFFGVKNGRVFIPYIMNWQEKMSKKYGSLPVESHDINPYYLYEYCRY